MALSKKIRFDVFKRDSFTCAYCGKKPPEAVLEADHIEPKSKGGTDILENLITACFDCNRGKSNNELNEIPKNENFDLLKEKYDQLKEFYNFQKKYSKLKEEILEDVCEYWSELWNGSYSINSQGKLSIKFFLRDFESNAIKEAMDIAVGRVRDSAEGSFKYMCGILHARRKERQKIDMDNFFETIKDTNG